MVQLAKIYCEKEEKMQLFLDSFISIIYTFLLTPVREFRFYFFFVAAKTDIIMDILHQHGCKVSTRIQIW